MAVALTVAAAAGCGSDDDAATLAESTATAPVRTAQGADDREIRAVFEQMRTALAVADERRACAVMADGMRRDFARMAGNAGGTCESGFASYLEGGDVVEDTDPELLRIQTDGTQAIVSAKVSGSKRPQRAFFIRERDDWKVRTWLRD
ncbi:MAG TPA: hypothetical protein VHF88_05910 [Thermoleophilaceae bacterium]|nr:hypothetical protein [Thermoleophilaceae bacterium]